MSSPRSAEAASLEAVASFLSASQRALLPRVGETVASATAETEGAALFVDVVGFSQLAGRLAVEGPRGAEILSGTVETFFGGITDLILESGGDVLAFIGDAVLAVWAGGGSELPDAVLRAAAAAESIQSAMATSTESETLRLRAAVGAGSIRTHQLGGVDAVGLFHATGSAILGATRANAECPVGRTVLTGPAWKAVADRATAAPVADGLLLLERLDRPAPPAEPTATIGSSVLPEAIAAAAPRVVVDRIRGGFADWLGEFRRVSVGFVSLAEPTTDPAALEAAVGAIQEVLGRYGGQPYQLVTDDKGTTCVFTFGLPPESHEDDPHRAVVAALGIKDRLDDLGVVGGIGLTTAVVYAGLYGRPARRQYSIVGPSINLAARLMQAAGDAVWCDEATARAAVGRRGNLWFEEAGERRFKGIEAPVTVLRPFTGTATTAEWNASVVGRVRERSTLSAAVGRYQERGDGECWVLSGDAGIGKSRLLAEVRAEAGELGMQVLRVAGDPIEAATPYFAWRRLFRSIVDARPADDPWPAGWSLFGPVLGRSLTEAPELAGLSDEVKAERRRGLLASLVEDLAAHHRVFLAVEDVHWLDSASLELLQALAKSSRAPLIVATGRKAADHPATAELLEVPGVHSIPLSGFDPAETRALIGQTLGADTVADALVTLIADKADGNPLFIEQVSLLLHEVGLIVVEGSTARIEEVEGDPNRALDQLLGSMGVPSTMQGIIDSRIDRLELDEQMVIKVASAIGRDFDAGTLAAACPSVLGPDRLATALASLVTHRLIEPDRSASDEVEAYLFGHAITQDAVYAGLSFAQRQEIHGRVARRYQEQHPSEPAWYPRLAHHWARAGEELHAAGYYRLAGADALRAYANAAAVSFLSEALRLEDSSPGFEADPASASARTHRAELELMLGRAYSGLSRYDRDQVHLRRGVALLGFGVPATGPGQLGAVLADVGRQLRRSLFGTRPTRAEGDEREALLQAAGAYERLAESFFYTGHQVATLLSCLRSLNLAERAGPSAELARAYASVGAVVALLTLRRASLRYGDRALATAREVDPAGALPWVAVIVGVSRASEGDWDRAAPLFREAETVAGSVGDWRRWADAVGHLATQAAWAGRVEEALARGREILASAREAKDPRYEAGVLPLLARLELQLGRRAETERAVERMGELLQVGLKAEAVTIDAHRRGLRALALAHGAHWDEAFREARAGLEVGKQIDPAGALYESFQQLVDLGEVAELGLEAGRPEAIELLDGVVRALRRYARVHPVAEPPRLRFDGVRRRARGDRSGAARRLNRATTLARRYGMELEALLAEVELGCHVLTDSTAAAALRERTAAALGRVGYVLHERRVMIAGTSS